MTDTFEVIVHGATGFTGRQVAARMAAGAPPGLRWAIAGRSREKLEALAATTHPTDIIVADSQDHAAIDALVRRARVVATTAGPYLRHGTPLVDACVEHGVHYVDITGETPWVKRLVDRHHATAAARGTRIIPFCGFDSVPSDLGTLAVVDYLRTHQGAPTLSVSASFTMGGGINGGTAATLLAMAEDKVLDQAIEDVLLLNPPDRQSDAERARSGDLDRIYWDGDREAWLTPFIMAFINTRVVRRSNGLLMGWGEGYGPAFTYREAMETRSRARAVWMERGVATLAAAVRGRAGRWLTRRLVPAPGEGPSEEQMNTGFFRLRLIGEAENGERVLATMKAQGDPGNRVTTTILTEAALLLASEPERLPGGPARGGVLTPATGLGLPLLDRLRARGFELDFQVLAE
jgi:short subunit dehydrogenase-like uncharacterized protein